MNKIGCGCFDKQDAQAQTADPVKKMVNKNVGGRGWIFLPVSIPGKRRVKSPPFLSFLCPFVIPDLIGDPEERRHIIIVRASGRKELCVTGFPCRSTGMTENKKGMTENKKARE